MTSIYIKIKNSPPGRQAVCVDLCACCARTLFHHPTKRPTFSNDVGFGRRGRGNTSTRYILGAILLPTYNASMVLGSLDL